MTSLALIAAALFLGLAAPLAAQDAPPSYDFREPIRALAFDPDRFFPDQPEPAMSIRYLGDDYGFPVYAIAVRRGCTHEDQGEARRMCGERLTARMVRSPSVDNSTRLRARGQRLFATIAQMQPRNDDDLVGFLDKTGLEWLEADVRKCPAALAHLATGRDLKFSPSLDQADQLAEIVLHADKVTFEIGDYLTRSRYVGWLKPESPGRWAHEFAASLETCWKPSSAPVPWRPVEK